MIMILPPVTATGEGISVERNTETSVRRSRRANPACVRMAAPGSKYGRAEAMGSGSRRADFVRGTEALLDRDQVSIRVDVDQERGMMIFILGEAAC